MLGIGLALPITNSHIGIYSPPPPLAPTGLSAVQNGAGQMDLDWTDNSGDEDGFSIRRSLDGVSNWIEVDTVLANVTVYSDTGLAPDVYYYRVVAFNAVGFSSYSNIASAEIV